MTIVDFCSLRQHQLQVFREQLLQLRLLADCIGDIETDLRRFIAALDATPPSSPGVGAHGADDLVDRLEAIAGRLAEILQGAPEHH